jgi:hypothetical protein
MDRATRGNDERDDPVLVEVDREQVDADDRAGDRVRGHPHAQDGILRGSQRDSAVMSRSRPPRCPAGRGCSVCTDPERIRWRQRRDALPLREAPADIEEHDWWMRMENDSCGIRGCEYCDPRGFEPA